MSSFSRDDFFIGIADAVACEEVLRLRFSLLGECAIPQLESPLGEPTIDDGDVNVRSSINMQSGSDGFALALVEDVLLSAAERAAAEIPPIRSCCCWKFLAAILTQTIFIRVGRLYRNRDKAEDFFLLKVRREWTLTELVAVLYVASLTSSST